MTYHRSIPFRNTTTQLPIIFYFMHNIEIYWDNSSCQIADLVILFILKMAPYSLFSFVPTFTWYIYLYIRNIFLWYQHTLQIWYFRFFIPIMLIKVIQYCVRFLWHYKKDITSIESDMIVWERITFYDRMGSAKIWLKYDMPFAIHFR